MTGKAALTEVGEFAVEMIRERVRGKGQGVKSEGVNARRLKPLSPKWIAQRARFAALHPETSPSRSNLTYTGEMLDGLYYVIKKGEVIVSVRRGDAMKKAIFTNEIRPWANLSKGEITKIRQAVERLVKRNLRG
jgi:hypothetical protein